MQRFIGETAIVTGGGNGIGAASAKRLAAEGATVVVADRDEAAAAATVAAIIDAGGHAQAAAVDVTDRASVQAMAERKFRSTALANRKRLPPRLPFWHQPIRALLPVTSW